MLQRFDPTVPNSGSDPAPTSPSAALEFLRRFAEESLASIGDAAILADPSGRILAMNSVAEVLTGWSENDASGRALGEILRLSSRLVAKPSESAQAHAAAAPGQAHLVSRDGTERPIAYSLSPISGLDANLTGHLVVFRSVTQSSLPTAHRGDLIRLDAITGLAIRQEFEAIAQRALEQSARHQKSHALLHIDIDNFKLVNDTCGNAAGDELLRRIAGVLVGQLRESDLLARLGSDEFGVLLECCPLPHAERIARAMVEAVREYRFQWEDRMFSVGASIGIAALIPGSGAVRNVLAAADAACATAKERGRNQIQVFRADNASVLKRHDELGWVERVSVALEENQFVLFRQEATALDARRSDGAYQEVLLRMKGEGNALSLPGSFVPIAERYKLMPAIDRWVVRTFLGAHRRRVSVDPPGAERYAINLSGTSINDQYFLEFLVREIESSGVSPRRLCFEITETAAIANFTWAGRFISVLRGMGCQFALDDFGAGVSSLAYVRRLPFDYVKIDGAFIKGMVIDPVQRAIVESIQRVGRLMGVKTVAEGVEDASTLEALRSIGVDYAQGYFVHRPTPFYTREDYTREDAADPEAQASRPA